MEEELRQFLNDWIDPNKRREDQLKDIYSRVFNRSLDKCPSCRVKAINDLQKYLELTYGRYVPPQGNRRYLLKPGNHQFVSGGPNDINNENTNDTILEAYLNAYPYIRALFIKTP